MVSPLSPVGSAQKQPKLKVLVTASTFPRWKEDMLPPFVFELSRRLGEHFDVHTLAPHSLGAKTFERYAGITIHRFRYFPERYEILNEAAIMPAIRANPLLLVQVGFFCIAQFIALARIVAKYDIDVIHAHWTVPQGLLAVLYRTLFRKRGIKVMMTSHGVDIGGIDFRPYLFINKRVINSADILTVVSRALKNEAYLAGAKKDLPIEVVPMGIDFTRFSPSSYSEEIRGQYGIKGPFLLFVGSLLEWKGVRYLIEAMPSILGEFPEAKLLLIGGGEEKERLLTLCTQLGLTDRSVTFLGPLPNEELPKFYATADIFIGPSLQEGFGLVFVEAIASGAITVGTDLPAIADIIEEGRTGFTVKPGDPAGIAEKVIYILRNIDTLKGMREKARAALMDRLDWQCIADRYADLIRNMVKQGPAA